MYAWIVFSPSLCYLIAYNRAYERKWDVDVPCFFKYNGMQLNEPRTKATGRKISTHLDDIGIVPCILKRWEAVLI